MFSGRYDADTQSFKHEVGCRCSDCNAKRLAVLDGWTRDIRGWLETQPGPTEGDASPLDGIRRVMERKEARIDQLERELAAAEARIVPVHAIFDGPPSPPLPRFVEVETPDGKSIRLGQWINRGDGYWALVFNVPIDQTTGYEAAKAAGGCDE